MFCPAGFFCFQNRLAAGFHRFCCCLRFCPGRLLLTVRLLHRLCCFLFRWSLRSRMLFFRLIRRFTFFTGSFGSYLLFLLPALFIFLFFLIQRLLAEALFYGFLFLLHGFLFFVFPAQFLHVHPIFSSGFRHHGHKCRRVLSHLFHGHCGIAAGDFSIVSGRKSARNPFGVHKSGGIATDHAAVTADDGRHSSSLHRHMFPAVRSQGHISIATADPCPRHDFTKQSTRIETLG